MKPTKEVESEGVRFVLYKGINGETHICHKDKSKLTTRAEGCIQFAEACARNGDYMGSAFWFGNAVRLYRAATELD